MRQVSVLAAAETSIFNSYKEHKIGLFPGHHIFIEHYKNSVLKHQHHSSLKIRTFYRVLRGLGTFSSAVVFAEKLACIIELGCKLNQEHMHARSTSAIWAPLVSSLPTSGETNKSPRRANSGRVVSRQGDGWIYECAVIITSRRAETNNKRLGSCKTALVQNNPWRIYNKHLPDWRAAATFSC